jgi:hypothetical protein
MPILLTLAGLLIAAVLYALLVRRRAWTRFSGRELANALTASNEIAMNRIREAPLRRAEAVAAVEARPGSPVADERRTGVDRRETLENRRGRGRRTGGDRRQGAASNGLPGSPARPS